MISKTMAEKLNQQINAEIYSAYLYLSMSAHASFLGLRGAANWLTIQTEEELSHAKMMYTFLEDRGAKVVLEAIDAPPSDFGGIVELFEGVLAHEQKVTGLINDVLTAAIAEHDHASENFFRYFVTEQIEEEKNAGDIIARLKLSGDASSALFMIDNELGTRVFTPPNP